MTAAVLEVTPAEWQESALSWIEAFAMSGNEFSADDIRDKLPAPHHSSAWGNAFLAAKHKGLLIETDYRPSRIPSRRSGRSLHWIGNPGYIRKEES